MSMDTWSVNEMRMLTKFRRRDSHKGILNPMAPGILVYHSLVKPKCSYSAVATLLDIYTYHCYGLCWYVQSTGNHLGIPVSDNKMHAEVVMF